MISLPARAIEVKFLDQKWSPEAKKLTFGTHSALFGIEFAEKLFLINDQLSGSSSISKEFESKKEYGSEKFFQSAA